MKKRKLIKRNQGGGIFDYITDFYKYYIEPNITANNRSAVQIGTNKLGKVTVNGYQPAEGYHYFDKSNNKLFSYKNGKFVDVTPPYNEEITDEDLLQVYENLKPFENEAREGYKNGRWYPFDTKVKYDDPSMDRHHLGTQWDIGYGISVNNFTPQELQRITKYGLSDEEIKQISLQHLRRGNKALKEYFTNYNSIPKLWRMGALDMRYQLGSLGEYQKFLDAMKNMNLDKMILESMTKADGKPIIRRYNQRINTYFKR